MNVHAMSEPFPSLYNIKHFLLIHRFSLQKEYFSTTKLLMKWTIEKAVKLLTI